MDCRLRLNKSKPRCKSLSRIRGISKKNLSWKQAKIKYPYLSPKGNADKDKVINKKDCRPFNKKKHSVYDNPYYNVDIVASPRIYSAYQIIRYGKELGLPPIETHKELREKGFSGEEMRGAMQLYNQSQEGLNIGVYGG